MDDDGDDDGDGDHDGDDDDADDDDDGMRKVVSESAQSVKGKNCVCASLTTWLRASPLGEESKTDTT